MFVPIDNKERLRSIVHNFSKKHILVIGDIVADEYIIGDPERIAREAPVLVLATKKEVIIPGEAANVGMNIHSLGCTVSLIGLVGDDHSAIRLRQSLIGAGMNDKELVIDTNRPTSTKTRILAGNPQQHIVRIDRGDRSDMSSEIKENVLLKIKDLLPIVDAVILSDYDYGVLGADVIAFCTQYARELNKVITVDSHGSLFRFQGVTALTPNQVEAEMTLGMQINTIADVEEAGKKLLVGSDTQSVLITRGEEGMSLFLRNSNPIHIPVHIYPHASDVVDTTGAGDTVAATFTLSQISGATMIEAAWLANMAAARVVRKMGCATNTSADLLEMIG